MSEPTDSDVILAMRRYGGGFVSRLAEAAMFADKDNLATIKAAFPVYWETYTRYARDITKNGGQP